MDNNTISPPHSQFLIYQAHDGQVKIDVKFDDNTVRLSQKLMAELFGVDRTVITKHIGNIFEEWELGEDSVSANFAHTASDSKSYMTKFYNLDMIISVWYRVSSKQATQFRMRATTKLKEYIIKWFTMDDERLKYSWAKSIFFQELLQRIRDIRSSERNLYQKVTDIFATSIDYDSEQELTQQFFATVQNKMHYAVHGKTAAELIHERANSETDNMGLTNFKNGYITEYDIGVAKNYLTEKELQVLNLIVSLYLDFAELQALNQESMTMTQRICKLDDFLKLSQKSILEHAGNISHQQALEKARHEFEKYKTKEMLWYSSDFDHFIESANRATKST